VDLRFKANWQRVIVYGVLTVGLLAGSAAMLALEHYVIHHEFLLHLAAIPLEILLGAVLVERFLHWHAKGKKKQQLMYIKSYFFRSEMRKVFLLNFRALIKPAISIQRIKEASTNDLKQIRKELDALQYGGPAQLEPILDAYIESSDVFDRFMEWAIANDFEGIFRDMINLLHFIQDVELFKQQNPGKLFAEEASQHPELAEKMNHVLRDGVSKFLDYAIELKEKQPQVFAELMNDYSVFERMQELTGQAGPSQSAQ